jgi:hypothetical protein
VKTIAACPSACIYLILPAGDDASTLHCLPSLETVYYLPPLRVINFTKDLNRLGIDAEVEETPKEWRIRRVSSWIGRGMSRVRGSSSCGVVLLGMIRGRLDWQDEKLMRCIDSAGNL